jgi:taurine dioxygenase
MKATPITGALGAEISGVDLSQITNDQASALDDYFHQHLVLVFRDQSLDPQNLLTLTEQLGGPGDTPYLTGLPDYPDVVPIIKEATEKSAVSFGSGWHTDFTFQAMPPSRTLLFAQDTPPTGGDTLFANLYTAYDGLSQGLKDLLNPLKAVHSATRSYGPKSTLGQHLENMVIHKEKTEPLEQLHPVVRYHPKTSRPALWVNPTYTIRFQGMTEIESKPLLDYLNQLIIQPSLTCRVSWAPGTLVMWDNRCTQHCATSDYHGHRRAMLRTTVAGEIPTNRDHPLSVPLEA